MAVRCPLHFGLYCSCCCIPVTQPFHFAATSWLRRPQPAALFRLTRAPAIITTFPFSIFFQFAAEFPFFLQLAHSSLFVRPSQCRHTTSSYGLSLLSPDRENTKTYIIPIWQSTAQAYCSIVPQTTHHIITQQHKYVLSILFLSPSLTHTVTN